MYDSPFLEIVVTEQLLSLSRNNTVWLLFTQQGCERRPHFFSD